MNSINFLLNSLKTRITLLTLVIFVGSIWLLVIYASRMLHEDLQRMLGEQQFETVSMVAQEINDELSDRLHGLELVATGISPGTLANPQALQTLLEARPVFLSQFNGGAFVTDINGIALASLPLSAQRNGVSYIERDHVSKALKDGKPAISKPVLGKRLQRPVVSLAAPIRDSQGRVTGTIVGVINLELPNFLSTATARSYGKGGGYLVVDRQHRLIVTATNKRRILEQSPPAGVIPLVDRYLQGYEGTDVFVNPLGLEVLQSNKAVPVANWYVAAQLPTAEAFAPIHLLQQRMLLAATVLTLLATLLTWWLLHCQLAPLLNTAKTLASLTPEAWFPEVLPITRTDEVGNLIAGFNQLLNTLRKRDTALASSEARFRALIEWTPDPTFVHRDGKFIFLNPAAVRLFGAASAQDLLEQPILDRIHPDSRQMVLERIQRSLDEHIDGPMVLVQFIKLDGSTMEVEVTGTSMSFDGRLATQAVAHDVTERNQNQRRLERLLQEQKVIIDSELIGISRIRQRVIQWANPTYEKMLGYDVGQLAYTPTRQNFLSEEAWLAFAAAAYPELTAGRIYRGQLEQVRKDGSHIWVDLRGTLIDARTGDSLWMSIDITERRQTDQKLRTFSRIVEQAPMSIVITDLMGTIEYANPWTSTVIGYGLEELIGQNPRVLKSGQTPPEVYADLWQTLGAGQVWRGEFLNRKKSGEVLVEQAVVAPVLADDEHITHYVALKEDITLRKQAAQALESIEWRFRRAIEEAPLPIMIHAQDGTVLSISRTWSELSGYSLQDIPSIADWTERAYGGRMQTVRKYIGTLYEKSERVHEGEYIIRCRDGSERIWDFSSVGLGTMPDGRRIVSSMALDVTQRKHQEQALQDSLNDKVALLNEVHHRVKNNLQVITSLLRLEARRSTLPETQSVLKDMQGRIHSMALLHESLYRSGIFASVDLGSYIKQIATQAFRAQASGAARLELNLASLQVNMDLATPCGLLVNELVSNCLKHAFPEGRRGEVRIELEAVPWADLPHVADAPDLAAPNYASALWRLRVSDTGVGLPADFETRRSQSLGLQLVGDLTRQLDATLEIGAGPGAQFTMTFRQPVL